MVKGKTTRTVKRATKKTYRRRGTKVSRVVSTGSPIPDRYFTKLKYSQLTALSFGASGNPASTSIGINNLFAPLSGGHQPLGYDELSALYTKYRVYGMKYKLYMVNRETAYQLEVAIQSRPDTNTHTNMDTICESPYSSKMILPVEGGGSIRVFRGFASVAKICGVNKNVVKSDDEYDAVTSGGPTVTPMLTIYMQNQNTDTAGTCAIRIELEYFCEFFGRKILTQS